MTSWAGRSAARRLVGADLSLICANIFAQKALPILETAGHSHRFPFLEREIVELALHAADNWPASEPKDVLKRSLERWLPPEMIYRPKGAFVDPAQTVFYDPGFLDHLAETTNGVLAALVHPERVRQIHRRLTSGAPLPAQTLNFVWALVFTDRWYRTAL